MIVKKDFNAAGTTFKNRQKYIQYLVMQKKNFKIRLTREKNNKADPNAVKILAITDDKKIVQIGYVPREIAATIAPIMDKGSYIYVNSSKIVGGGKNYSYGMKLNIGWYN